MYCNYIFFKLSVQFYFEGVSNCNLWRENETATKVAAVSNIMLNFIKNQCLCDFPEAQINQTDFSCIENFMNYVAVSIQILAFSNYNITQLIATFQSLPKTLSSVILQGETFFVSSYCLIISTNFSSDIKCYPSMQTTFSSLISSTSTIASTDVYNDKNYIIIVALTLPFLLFCVTFSTFGFIAICKIGNTR